MKKKLYVDTSVWNQLEQDERPDRKEIAEKFVSPELFIPEEP